jgi:hypothetical protein
MLSLVVSEEVIYFIAVVKVDLPVIIVHVLLRKRLILREINLGGSQRRV